MIPSLLPKILATAPHVPAPESEYVKFREDYTAVTGDTAGKNYRIGTVLELSRVHPELGDNYLLVWDGNLLATIPRDAVMPVIESPSPNPAGSAFVQNGAI